MRVMLFGASGSGCTTLGTHLAKHLGVPLFDSDEFYWEKTIPPFTTPVEKQQRDVNLLRTLQTSDNWVLSGSVVAWDIEVRPLLSLAIYVQLAPEERMLRLAAREAARYGHRADPGGDLYESSQAFLEWARGYDGSDAKRSSTGHTAWLATLPCPRIVFVNEASFEQSFKRLLLEVEKALFV